MFRYQFIEIYKRKIFITQLLCFINFFFVKYMYFCFKKFKKKDEIKFS